MSKLLKQKQYKPGIHDKVYTFDLNIFKIPSQLIYMKIYLWECIWSWNSKACVEYNYFNIEWNNAVLAWKSIEVNPSNLLHDQQLLVSIKPVRIARESTLPVCFKLSTRSKDIRFLQLLDVLFTANFSRNHNRRWHPIVNLAWKGFKL